MLYIVFELIFATAPFTMVLILIIFNPCILRCAFTTNVTLTVNSAQAALRHTRMTA